MMRNKCRQQAAFSGGGNRAASSGAAFALALMKEGVWEEVEVATGVSGGSWFLKMTRPGGRLHGVLKCDAEWEDVSAVLQANGMAAPLSSTDREKAVDEVVKAAEDLTAPLVESTEKAFSMWNPTTWWAKPVAKKAVEVVTEATLRRAAEEAVRKFGSGARVAVSKSPIDNWTAYLEQSLFKTNGDEDAAAVGGPKIEVAAITPGPGSSYVWTIMPVGSPDDSDVKVLTHKWEGDAMNSNCCTLPALLGGGSEAPSSNASATVISDRERSELLRYGGVVQMPRGDQALKPSRVAAICGSAFAFDYGHVLSRVIPSYQSSTVIKNVTTTVPFTDSRGRKVPLELRDAGIDVNVPYIAATGGNAPAVLWVHDSSAGATLKSTLDTATSKGHLPDYQVVAADDDAESTGEGSRWCIFTTTEDEPSAPRFIVNFLGCVDDETMEPQLQDRADELAQLHVEMRRGVAAAKEKLMRIINAQ